MMNQLTFCGNSYFASSIDQIAGWLHRVSTNTALVVTQKTGRITTPCEVTHLIIAAGLSAVGCLVSMNLGSGAGGVMRHLIGG